MFTCKIKEAEMFTNTVYVLNCTSHMKYFNYAHSHWNTTHIQVSAKNWMLYCLTKKKMKKNGLSTNPEMMPWTHLNADMILPSWRSDYGARTVTVNNGIGNKICHWKPELTRDTLALKLVCETFILAQKEIFDTKNKCIESWITDFENHFISFWYFWAFCWDFQWQCIERLQDCIVFQWQDLYNDILFLYIFLASTFCHCHFLSLSARGVWFAYLHTNEETPPTEFCCYGAGTVLTWAHT